MRNLTLWIVSVIFLFCISLATAQSWSIVNPEALRSTGQRDIIPQRYIAYSLDFAAMKDLLWTAPDESSVSVLSSTTVIIVGLADGTEDRFRIVAYDMMEPDLKERYTEIKTFRGVSVSNPYRRIRVDWTNEGFRAVISDLEGKTYIDPFQRQDLAHRIVYYKKDFIRDTQWACGVEEEKNYGEETVNNRVFGDCQFRTYRLALATTAEYSNFFGATSAAQSSLVMAQVVTAVNRVNEVYEADFTTRLLLVANTNNIFYYNSATDPYTNNNGSTMLTQNQTTCDGVIGNANYDIGHVFSTGGGGVAVLNAVCSAANKAKGVTGSSNPVGDPFIIDYVAHEMGHQFGGSHTFNGTAGSCNGNRSASSAYEPGSGSTIMAYAGICGAQNLQPNSDAYMHARSLLQITNQLAATSCAGFITFNNNGPVAANVPNYTIPISTPFVLTASVTDPNNDPLTYCWEQYDLESTSTDPPASNDTDGPMFRSFNPVAIPERYFPRLQDLTQNLVTPWEVLPSVSRTMTFRMTARDYHEIAGCTSHDDVVVTTNSNAGPFVVTSQNSATTWLEGATETITWNVANTTASPVNCSHVDIYMSTDGGLTYPVVLSLNEPNDGSAAITVPSGTTTTARIMVKASNNVFFDINNSNIKIDPGIPNFTINLNPSSVIACNDGSVQTTVVVGQILGFSDPVFLSAFNLPPGATATFLPPVVTPGNNSTLILSNLFGLTGIYTPTIRGTSSTGNKDAIFTMTLVTTPGVPDLLSPADNANNAQLTPLLDWAEIIGSLNYDYQIATDVGFNTIIQSGTTASDQFQVTTPLLEHTVYYWRVRVQNPCGIGDWATPFSFTTNACVSLMSTNVPIAIPSQGTPTVTSVLTIPNPMTITDLNVINLVGTHTYMNDLRFSIISPGGGTEVVVWDRPCGSENNFNINLDDEAADSNWPCPPVDGLTYMPSNPMTPFDGLMSDGIWTLKIQDLANQDGGSLTSWGLKVCGVPTCQLLVNQLSGTGPGSLIAAINCAVSGDTIVLSASLSGQTIDIGNKSLWLDKNLVIQAAGANINVAGSGNRIFEVSADAQVEFLGFTIIAGSSLTGGAISNEGVVKMKNLNIDRHPDFPGATLIENSAGAQFLISGSCTINQ